jgi:pyruvate-ferredoxin/flavodoxin oxidoreductase
MTYGTAYVASFLANPAQAVKAFIEAEAFDGPSLILAYAHCIAHGINMTCGIEEQKKAVECGHWPLFRYNPALAAQGKNPLQLDSKAPTLSFEEYALGENRYRVLKKVNPKGAERLFKQANEWTARRFTLKHQMAKMIYSGGQENKKPVMPNQCVVPAPEGLGFPEHFFCHTLELSRIQIQDFSVMPRYC